MRPKKERWVRCKPSERCFRPTCKKVGELDGIVLTIDELEAMRLIYLNGLKQDAAAARMKVHRSTVSRILAAANKKVADALVNIKAIKVEGGHCKILISRRAKK